MPDIRSGGRENKNVAIVMSHWRHIEELEKKLPDITIEQLEEVIRFRRQHAQRLQPKICKLAMKRVHALESLLQQKQSEREHD